MSSLGAVFGAAANDFAEARGISPKSLYRYSE